MHYIELLFANPIGDSSQLEWSATQVRLKDFDCSRQVFLEPTIWSAHHRYLMPESLQLLREKLAVHDSSVDVAARDDLQDFQVEFYRS